MTGRTNKAIGIALALWLAAPCAPATAQPAIEIGAGRTLLVRLSAPARSVVLGDPTIADVTVEAPNLLVVFGKRAGGTSLIVLGAGRTILVETGLLVQSAGPGGVTVTYGAGKGIDPGGRTIAYACGTICARTVEARKAPPAAKPAGE